MPTSLDAAGLRRWAEHAVGVLVARRDDINALNVFPVADADTGSNMAFTMRAAAEQAAELDDALPADLAQALAVGAVRGARGNSGMVLSQVLRAIADEVGDTGLDGPHLARALVRAVDYVHRAISQPVEGTIVTVLRAAADGARAAVDRAGGAAHDASGSAGGPAAYARSAADGARTAARGAEEAPNGVGAAVNASQDKANSAAVRGKLGAGGGSPDISQGAGSDNLVVVLDAAISAASEALEATPSQLPALQEAGVVDAGGAGLVLVLAAMRDATTGGQDGRGRDGDIASGGRWAAENIGGATENVPAAATNTPVGSIQDTSAEPRNNAAGSNAAVSRAMGSGAAASSKAFPSPGKSIGMPHETHGVPGEIEVVFFFRGDLTALEDALRPLGNSLIFARVKDDQASVHIHSPQAGRVIETTFGLGEVDDLRLEALPATSSDAPGGNVRERRRTLFAAAPAGPVAELFASAGARVVEPGEEIAGAQEDDIVLRNGTRTRPGAAHVVNTGSLVAGIAAISVYDDTIIDTRDAVATMEDAAAAMRVDYPGEDTLGAILGTCRDLLFGGGEQITVLSPTHIDAAAMSAQLGVDVMALQVPGMRTEIGVE